MIWPIVAGWLLVIGEDDSLMDASIAPILPSEIDFSALRAWGESVPATKNPELDAINKMNSRFAVVREGGSVTVWELRLENGQTSFQDFTSINDFFRWVAPIKIEPFEGKPERMAGKVWFDSPLRREYDGTFFDAENPGDRDGKLNLFTGWGVAPVKGDASPFWNHFREVCCDNNLLHFEYGRRLLASFFQKANTPGQVAIVLQGDKGTGKGFVGNTIVKLAGNHGIRTDRKEHLLGGFNAHLANKTFMFADESLFAGDPSAVSILNGLITEDSLVVTKKYRDSVATKNRLHLVIATNENWAIRASTDERRYFSLKVSSVRQKDFAYFQRLADWLKAGGYEALLYDLLNMDLSGFNARAVPVTESLSEQKRLSQDMYWAWWEDCLHRGAIWEFRALENGEPLPWLEEVSASLLLASLEKFRDGFDSRRRKAVNDRAIAGFLKDALGQLFIPSRDSRSAVLEEYFDGYQKCYFVRRGRARIYKLPSLEVLRELYVQRYGNAFDDCAGGEGGNVPF